MLESSALSNRNYESCKALAARGDLMEMNAALLLLCENEVRLIGALENAGVAVPELLPLESAVRAREFIRLFGGN